MYNKKKYLSIKHFDNLLKEAGEKPENFDRRERLSSKAMLYSTGTKLFVFYVNTLVFKKDLSGTITLNTDGWQTNTTKKHINHALALAGFDYYVSQKDFKWYIVDGKTGENSRPFTDKMILKVR